MPVQTENAPHTADVLHAFLDVPASKVQQPLSKLSKVVVHPKPKPPDYSKP